MKQSGQHSKFLRQRTGLLLHNITILPWTLYSWIFVSPILVKLWWHQLWSWLRVSGICLFFQLRVSLRTPPVPNRELHTNRSGHEEHACTGYILRSVWLLAYVSFCPGFINTKCAGADMTTCSFPSRRTTWRFRSGLASSDLHKQLDFSVNLLALSQMTTRLPPAPVVAYLPICVMNVHVWSLVQT